MEDYHNLDIDFTKYNTDKRTVMPHQVEAVKFMLSRKRCIIADEMGSGKTFSAILAALEGKFKHILVICPSSVKKTWEKELKLLVDEKDITIVQGSKWDDAKFTIINYDILDNFYEIPEQIIKTSELNVGEDGNVKREYKEKKIVARSKKIIDEAMANSQLFQSNYDLVIIDEAHRLSNNTSNRFKIINDLLKRSKPDGIFELTGTMVTNSTKNLYNLLKLIDVPVTKDWQHFMERYCGAKFFYKKNEKNAYTTMFLKEKKKETWYDLTFEEKKELDEILEKKCKKICIPGEDTNMEELQEIIKPYYLRRLKNDFAEMTTKTIKYLHYEMTEDERKSYDELWEKYLELQEDKEKTEKNKKLIEVSLMRQWLADKMIPKTINIVRKCIEVGRKIVIFCAYDNEINKFKEEFGDICVYHNGKLNEKKKNNAVERFQNDEKIKVFIGNIFSAGVGLTLTEGSVVVFNNFSFVPSDNLQCEDRVYRIGQDKPCTIYYQSFNETYFDKMLEIVHNKENVIDKIIITEKEK
jgi:SNF2 family DNA or RNA helicase